MNTLETRARMGSVPVWSFVEQRIDRSEKDFLPKEALKNLSTSEYKELTEEIFNSIFEGTPIKRTKFPGFKRNVIFLEPEKLVE